MYSCSEEDNENVDRHTAIAQEHCGGGQTCTVPACDEFFGTTPNCRRPKLWLFYRLTFMLHIHISDILFFRCDGENPNHSFKLLRGRKGREACEPPTSTPSTTPSTTTTPVTPVTPSNPTPSTPDPGIQNACGN